MNLTEQQQQWLDDLVFKGEVFHEISLLNGNVTITLVNISGEKQLEVEKAVAGSDGTALYVMHQYALNLLSQVLKKFTTKEGTTEFKSAKEAYEFIKSRPTVIIDAMTKAQTAFEAELQKITAPEVVTENFSKTPETAEGSNSI